MRHIPYALLILAATAGLASAQATSYSIPVGYVTETVLGSQFNNFGITMHQTPVASGVLDADDTDSVTDNQVNFTTLLTSGKTYILEITSGAGAGAIQEVTAWTGSDLSTVDDLSALVDATTTYALRPASTISDVFGASNSAGLQASANADPSEADVVYIPDGSGGFSQVFYSTADAPYNGWLDSSTFESASDKVVVYTDGLLLERKGATNLEIVINGEVKKTSTITAVTQPFNYLSAVYPVGVTLGNSNLSSSLLSSPNADPSEADVVYIPDGSGGFIQAFYSTADAPYDGWINSSDFTQIPNQALTSGILIERKSPTPYNITLTPPPGYSSL